MSGGNPRTAGWNRAQYTDKSTTKQVVATDSGTLQDVIAPKSAKHTVYVQRIEFNVTTDFAATLTFQDDNGTPKVVGVSPSSPGLGMTLVADYGADGVPLTEGKNLDIVISGAGLAGQVKIDAYEKLTGTRSYLDGASVQ